MTEEEHRQQRWVELRAACTEQGTFDQIAEAIERDVERFNKLTPQCRRDRTFKCERSERSTVCIAEVNGSGELLRNRSVVNVVKTNSSIHVYRDQDCQFAIAQEWNEDTLCCELKSDGNIYSIWQISQKAIGNLLFGYR